MKWFALLVAIVCTTVAIADAYQAPRPETGRSNEDAEIAKEEITKLQGTWICVWDQRNGNVNKREIGTRFVFQGDLMTQQRGAATRRWRFRVHPRTEPKGIDWFETHGTVTEGIFWASDDTLVFCDGFPVGKRPDHFSDASHLNVLRRVEPKQTAASAVRREKDGGSHQQPPIGKSNAWIDTYEFVVPANRNQENPVVTKVRFQEGEVFILDPAAEDQWGAHGPDGPLADYRGLGRTDSLLTLHFRIGESAAPVSGGRPITVISPGSLELYCQDNQPWNNVGEVRVQVIRLKTNK